MPRENALERLSCRATRSQSGLKREMRRLPTATEKLFPTQLTKETEKDSESGWESGKG